MLSRVLVVLLSLAGQSPADPSRNHAKYTDEKAQPKSEWCVLLAITDGDSILVRCERATERVRMIGIDAPEIHHGDHSERQSIQFGRSDAEVLQMGRSARAHLADILTIGQTLELRQDREPRDRFGRLLAYVYTPNGTMINSKLVADGYAAPMSIKPNTTYKFEIEALYSEARRERRGLWSQTK